MADANGRVVGRGSTPPIMITDDHKSVVKVTPQAPPPEEEEIQPAKRKRRLARDPDPVEVEREPRAKRRAKEQTPPSSVPSAASTPQASGTSFFPQQYSQRFDSSPRFTHPSAHASQSPSTFTTAPSSPIISALNAPSPSGSGVFLHYPVTNEAQLPPTAKPSIALNESHYLPPVDELETLQSLASASSVASPVSVHDIAQVPAASIFSTLTAFGTAPPEGPNPGPSPQIHRLIPSSGPTHGGIEVTVLGSNFMPTLRCVFGDTVAASTQMWSETTLVCLLPPSATPGPVVVSFEGMPLAVGGGAGPGANGQGLQLFNYLDNSDRAL
ncbi:hypothetical protein DL93DRAFT_2078545 [Clavulina sp. PMI_390]|nr:hypothetical protein DL93DRAFT_2078545 [Clavulina sp. PMI_390]